MKTIQIIVDEQLLKRIDDRCSSRGRSAFFREAAQRYLKQLEVLELERRHKQGYSNHPVRNSEFSVWESEQVWPD